MTAPATRGGDLRAMASGRWAELGGRVSRLRVRTLTRGRLPGHSTPPAAATPTCCAEHKFTVQGGGRSGGGRSLPEIALSIHPPEQISIRSVPGPGGLRAGECLPRGFRGAPGAGRAQLSAQRLSACTGRSEDWAVLASEGSEPGLGVKEGSAKSRVV